MKIHDHFSGSAHCAECRGWCQLTGNDLELTRLIRGVMEYFEIQHNGWLPPFIEETLSHLVGDRLAILRKHCAEGCSGLVKP